MKTVPEMLEEAANTYRERNKLYGDNYKNFGGIMRHIFPKGVHVESHQDHNRFALFVQIVSKITRYAENFQRGGHDDSLLDLSVYANMLRELDAEIKSVEEFRKHATDKIDRERGK
jgi:hypothetical protein